MTRPPSEYSCTWLRSISGPRQFERRQGDGQRPRRLVPGEAGAAQPGEVDSVAHRPGHDQGLARGEPETALARAHHRDEAGGERRSAGPGRASKAGSAVAIASGSARRPRRPRGEAAAEPARARPSQQQAERPAGRRRRFRRRASIASLPAGPGRRRSRSIEMGEHRTAGGRDAAADRCPRYIASTIAGIRPSPRFELADYLPLAHPAMLDQPRGHGRAGPRPPGRAPDNRSGRRGRAAGRGSPYNRPCRRRAARPRWSTSP